MECNLRVNNDWVNTPCAASLGAREGAGTGQAASALLRRVNLSAADARGLGSPEELSTLVRKSGGGGRQRARAGRPSTALQVDPPAPAYPVPFKSNVISRRSHPAPAL